jgi:hypothetical protein
MPDQEGDEKRQVHYHEEWKAGDPGRVPGLRDKDVSDRQGLREKASFDIDNAGFGSTESGIIL